MAYLDVRDTIVTSPVPTSSRETVGFARQEWEVIVLAQKDGIDSLFEPSRLSRFLGWLFGASVSRRLADPRLEALRRLAVFAWHHGYAVPVSAMKAFKASGFSSDQLELLLASIAQGRSRLGRHA